MTVKRKMTYKSLCIFGLKSYYRRLAFWSKNEFCKRRQMSGNYLWRSRGTLAWKIPWAEEPGRLQSMGSLESDRTERLHFHFSLSCIGEGNGNPLQCSCLENPRDGEAWWAAVYGVAQSRTRLKQLSSSSSRLLNLHTFSFLLRNVPCLILLILSIVNLFT